MKLNRRMGRRRNQLRSHKVSNEDLHAVLMPIKNYKIFQVPDRETIYVCA